MVKKVIEINNDTNNKTTKVNENDTLEFRYLLKNYLKINSFSFSIDAITSEGKYFKGGGHFNCNSEFKPAIQVYNEYNEVRNLDNPSIPETVELILNFENKLLKTLFKNNDYNTRKIYIIPQLPPCDFATGGIRDHNNKYLHIIELEGKSAKDIIQRKDYNMKLIILFFTIILLGTFIFTFIKLKKNKN